MAIDQNPILPKDCTPDDSLRSPVFVTDIPDYALNHNRVFQGIPAIERTQNGRIFYAFYTGTEDEGVGNFVALLISDDEGKTMTEPYLCVMPSNPASCRVYDECLWFDPRGRLWFFVTQSYTYYDGRCGVWACVCDDPDAEKPTFSPLRRIANGIMMNKPIVYHDGTWLLPCAIWDKFKSSYNYIPEETYSNVYCSRDEGESFELLSHVDYPDRYIDEHMMVELKDGKILMLIRGKHGIGMAISEDGAKTWKKPVDSELGGPCARFCIKRLASGRLLLVNHYNFQRRNNLTAMLSEDEGKTWKGFLLLDERQDVSYPDCTEDASGNLYIVYDRERYGAKEILMAKVNEEDILAGAVVTEGSYLKRVINRATGCKKEEN